VSVTVKFSTLKLLPIKFPMLDAFNVPSTFKSPLTFILLDDILPDDILPDVRWWSGGSRGA
jgi:hypothetical protein